MTLTVKRLRLVYAGLAIVFLVAPLIASTPLLDPDEGLHAAIAQEMVLRADYVTPTFLGEPFFDKPILFFWTEALSLRLFGMNETAVRIPPLVFGLLGMLSVTWLGRRLFGETPALIAGIVYASMLLPLGVSQVAVHDIGLVPFMCVAMWCVLRAGGSRRPWLWGLPLGICLGLSILTKGLVGVVFVGMFSAWFALAHRDELTPIATALVIGGVVAAIVAAPWYAAMERAHPGYLHYYFVERHLQGYFTATQRHAGRPWWYYAPIVVGGTLPWTGYFAGAVRTSGSPSTRRVILVLWVWLAVGLVFLSFGESKLITYVLPLFPGLAILIGAYVARVWHAKDPAADAPGDGFRFGLGLQIAVLTFLPLVLALILLERYGFQSAIAWSGAVAAIPIIAFAGWRTWRARTLPAYIANVSIAIAACVMTLVFFIAPGATRWMTAEPLAQALNAMDRLPPRVLVLDERLGSLIFYLAPTLRAEATHDRILTSSWVGVTDRLRVDPDAEIIAVRDDELPRFQRFFVTPLVPLQRAGTFTLYRVDRLRTALEAPK